MSKVEKLQRTRPKSEFLTGARDQLPILLGVVPFGVIFGALAISVGIPPLAAQGFSLFVFAGSSQFIAVGLIGEMAPVIVILTTIFVVNLRHALYSASLSPHFVHLRMRWKLTLSWLLTDEAFATASTRYRRTNTTAAHWYTLGTGLTLFTAWQSSTASQVSVPSQNWPLSQRLSVGTWVMASTSSSQLSTVQLTRSSVTTGGVPAWQSSTASQVSEPSQN